MIKIKFSFVFFFLFSLNSFTAEVIALDSSYPPYMFERKGKAEGLYTRLLDEVFQKMEIEGILRLSNHK